MGNADVVSSHPSRMVVLKCLGPEVVDIKRTPGIVTVHAPCKPQAVRMVWTTVFYFYIWTVL